MARSQSNHCGILRFVGQSQVLILLAAAPGLRLGELLGLSVEDVSDNGLTITVRKQVYRGRVRERLKTTNAHRCGF